jgi:APA family basic amino acid/polyamine antiporter
VRRTNLPRAAPTGVRRVLDYGRLLVPVASEHARSLNAADLACSLAAEAHARIMFVSVIEVAPDLPLDAHMTAEEADARAALVEAEAIANSYGIPARSRAVRGREAGEEIVTQATRAASEIIVLGATRHRRSTPHAPVFGTTVQYVLKHAPCRVLVASGLDAMSVSAR